MNDRLVRIHLPGALLLVALLIALFLYLVFPPARVARTAFFPGTASDLLSGERRLIPRSGDDLREIEILLEEMLLGPASINHRPIVPRGVFARSVILTGPDIYVDLDDEALLDAGLSNEQVRLAMAAIEQTLTYNYRQVERVEITIGGNVPFAPAQRPIGR